MTSQSPTLARRALGTALAKLRDAKGLSIPDAAAAIGYSRQTLSRIEKGQQPSRTQQVESLCKLYGASPAQMSYLTGLARDSAQRGRWEAHKEGALPEFRMYAEAEQNAAAIQVVEPEYIPGLIQTTGYIRALQAVAPKKTDPGIAEAVMRFRLDRLETILAQPKLPTIQMVIGMQALAYLDHMPAVKDEQVERLKEVTKLGMHVRIATQLHPAMGSMFTILTPPPEGGPPFVYMDAMDGCRYVEDHDVVSDHQRAFVSAFKMAIPIVRYLE